ncbi:MAG: TlpA disulfide reductase family protein, partial [Alphaproteobacteria bacterium]
IWATWCGPCVKEMPSLEALQKNIGSPQFAILPLSEDRTDAAVSTFYQRHALTHLPIAIDHAGTAPSALHIEGLPTTLLINPQGEEIARIEGDGDWNTPDVIAFLREQMKTTASSRP